MSFDVSKAFTRYSKMCYCTSFPNMESREKMLSYIFLHSGFVPDHFRFYINDLPKSILGTFLTIYTYCATIYVSTSANDKLMQHKV